LIFSHAVRAAATSADPAPPREGFFEADAVAVENRQTIKPSLM